MSQLIDSGGRSEIQALIEIWGMRFDNPEFDDLRHLSILSEQERSRAASFRFQTDAARYVLAHAFQRLVLAKFAHTDPAGIKFSVERYGRPILSESEGNAKLCFSMSHTDTAVLIAVSSKHSVGVDVERVDPTLKIEPLLSFVLSSDELLAYKSTRTERRREAFYRIWTAKEALVKGVGYGLGAINPSSLSVFPFTNDHTSLNIGPEDSLWTVTSFMDQVGLMAAVACEGPQFKTVKRWLQFPEDLDALVRGAGQSRSI